jgi:hypothetical protein
LLDLDGKIGLRPCHYVVGPLHRAAQINQNLGMGAGEFEKPRRQPERPQALRACDPDFAPKRLGEHAAPADKSKRRFLHLLCAGQEMVTGPGQADAVAVTGEEYRADLVFQLLDSPRNAVTGHA